MRDKLESELLAEGRRLAARAGELLTASELTLSVAESSTGGLLSALITDVPGSSAHFAGALVPYSYESHEGTLGVGHALLEAHGAVSEETAREMATHARAMMSTDYALSVAGIAGPSGGTPAKPVGLTFVALADERAVLCERHIWSGDRIENRLRSALAALTLLIETLQRRR